jgi:hypothetical protein
MHAIDVGKLLGDLALRVVISLDDEDPNSCAPQPYHLIAKKQTRPKISPVTVVDIAREEDKCHALFDGQVHERSQRLTRSAPQAFHRSARIGVQPAERAVDMQVGGMDELHVELPLGGTFDTPMLSA